VAQEAATADAKPAASKAGAGEPKSCKVELGTLRVETTLKGTIEARRVAEVSLNPEAWTMPLTVEKAVEHGATVKKGDILLELDTDKIEQAIQDLRNERSLAEAALRHADLELPVLEKLLPLDLAAAERSKVRADEDLARFLEIDRPLAEQSAHFQVKAAQFRLESARDELAQLQKMYREKDLTEETEQLILKRHRFAVEAAEFQLKSSEDHLDRTLHIDLPRREQTARDDAAKQSLALVRARSLLPVEVSQKHLARDKLRFESEKNDEKLAKLERDRKAMTVRAPADGIVFYGKIVDGKWSSTPPAAQRLQKGGVLPPQEVVLVIIAPRPAFVRASIDEKDLHAVRPGLEGKAVPTGYPELKLRARLASISAIPQTPGSFNAQVDIDLSQAAEVLMPGMACAVTFVSYRKDDALTVPAAAVQTDETDDDVRYVYLARKEGNGKPRKQVVRVGKTGGGKTEILDGLKEGDEILSARP
jgi:multidrug efflux pump subunit AcrA (membrane-fusion protein)